MTPNKGVSSTREGSVGLPELAERLTELEATVEQQQSHIDDLERENDLLKRQLNAVRETIDEDGLTAAEGVVGDHGGIVPYLESIDSAGSNTSVSSEVREKMLPAHRMWTDVRDGSSDALDKSERRAAVLFGAFIRRAAGKSPSEDSTLTYNGVDASGQKYTLTSTEAKHILEQCEYIGDGKMYSSTVTRAFERVQQYTKTDSCDCSNIESCPHGLVMFDATSGTNRLHTNKARFNKAMENVVSAVEAVETGDSAEESASPSDDSVSPEQGQDEETGDRDEIRNELEELANGHHVEADDD